MKRTTQAAAALSTLAMGLACAGEASQADLSKQAKITQSLAERIALAKVKGGKVQSAEIENERGRLVWSFDISQSGTRNIREILVDANTGKIIYAETESPQAQAKEAAAEQQEAKKP